MNKTDINYNDHHLIYIYIERDNFWLIKDIDKYAIYKYMLRTIRSVI